MRRQISRLQWLLFGLCVFLLGILVYESVAPYPVWAPVAVSRVEHRGRAVPISPFVAPPMDTFAVIDARPVFNPQRTPIGISSGILSGTAAGSAAVGELSLIGVILDHRVRLALLRTPDKPLAVAVGVGTVIEGWQVVRIGNNRVVLRSNGVEQELLVSANKPAAAQHVNPTTQDSNAQ